MTPISDSGGHSVAATWQPTSEGNLTVISAAPDWEAAPERRFSVEVAQRPVYADQWGYQFRCGIYPRDPARGQDNSHHPRCLSNHANH